MTEASDPAAIRSIAVSVDDVVDAFVYSRENPGAAVLRVNPPFHGRMRARLHVYRVDDAPETGAVHVDPADLLAGRIVDDYPTLAGIEDRLADASPSAIRDAYADAVETWRARAREGIVDTVALETDDGTTRVEVKRLA
jgi:hypothetical protein